MQAVYGNNTVLISVGLHRGGSVCAIALYQVLSNFHVHPPRFDVLTAHLLNKPKIELSLNNNNLSF